MSRKQVINAEREACARCGYSRKAHGLANYSDGPMVGAAVLICPFATWKSPVTDDAVDPHAASTGKPSTRV